PLPPPPQSADGRKHTCVFRRDLSAHRPAVNHHTGLLMAQIKIYGLRSHLDVHRQALSDSIHACVMDALEYPPEKRFHRFNPLDAENFIYPDDRSERYTIIEISMFEGRSAEAKKRLITLLFSRLHDAVGIE